MTAIPVAFAIFPGGIEWVVIGLIALLLFGKRLPMLARSLGQSFSEFKSGLAGTTDITDNHSFDTVIPALSVNDNEETKKDSTNG